MSDASPGSTATAAEPPVPAPTGLLAEAVLPTPDATWKQVQANVGGFLSLAAPSFAGVVGSTMGAPEIAALADGAAVAYAAFGDGPDGALHYVVVVHLGRPEAAVGALTDGETARFVRAGEDEAITVLLPRGGTSPALGVAHGGFLLIATSRDDLKHLGPYAYRTLPSRPAPTSPLVVTIPRDSVTGPVTRLVTAKWESVKADLLAKDDEQRQAHGGREPDLGDPRAFVATLDGHVKEWLGALTDADHAELTFTLPEASLGGELLLFPRGEGPTKKFTDGLHTGDTAQLAAVPDSALVALEVRSDGAERAQTAKDTALALTGVLGARQPASDAKELAATLDAWAQARGDSFTVAVVGALARGLLVRARVSDEGQGAKAFEALVRRLDHPGVRDLAKTLLGFKSLRVAPQSVPGIGSGMLGTMERDASGPRAPTPATMNVFWSAQRGDLVALAAEDAPSLAPALFVPPRTLGDDARIHDALGRVGQDGSIVGVLRPFLSAASPRSDSAVFAVGRRGDRAMLRAEASGAFVREVMRRASSGGGL